MTSDVRDSSRNCVQFVSSLMQWLLLQLLRFLSPALQGVLCIWTQGSTQMATDWHIVSVQERSAFIICWPIDVLSFELQGKTLTSSQHTNDDTAPHRAIMCQATMSTPAEPRRADSPKAKQDQSQGRAADLPEEETKSKSRNSFRTSRLKSKQKHSGGSSPSQWQTNIETDKTRGKLSKRETKRAKHDDFERLAKVIVFVLPDSHFTCSILLLEWISVAVYISRLRAVLKWQKLQYRDLLVFVTPRAYRLFGSRNEDISGLSHTHLGSPALARGWLRLCYALARLMLTHDTRESWGYRACAVSASLHVRHLVWNSRHCCICQIWAGNKIDDLGKYVACNLRRFS